MITGNESNADKLRELLNNLRSNSTKSNRYSQETIGYLSQNNVINFFSTFLLTMRGMEFHSLSLYMLQFILHCYYIYFH